MDLRQFQRDHDGWLRHNFPDVQPWEALAGIVEEVGELSHAHLKGYNGIRGLSEPASVRAAKSDAIGDIFIYMVSYCNTNGLDLEECIERAWREVQARDWQADPQKGVSHGDS